MTISNQDLQKFKPTHTHIKSGNQYQVLFLTNENTVKWDTTTVYTDTNGALWSRPTEEFHVKFKQL